MSPWEKEKTSAVNFSSWGLPKRMKVAEEVLPWHFCPLAARRLDFSSGVLTDHQGPGLSSRAAPPLPLALLLWGG
jgi:hypothetical protein